MSAGLNLLSATLGSVLQELLVSWPVTTSQAVDSDMEMDLASSFKPLVPAAQQTATYPGPEVRQLIQTGSRHYPTGQFEDGIIQAMDKPHSSGTALPPFSQQTPGKGTSRKDGISKGGDQG